MLIVRGPGGFIGGRVCDSLVSQVDLFPTLCDVVGIDCPDWVQGVSIMPIIRGETHEVRDSVFAEVNYHAAYEPKRCVRTRRWKYIRRFDDRRKPVLSNCDDSPTKTVLLETGWADTALLGEELYNLVFDPNETHNLAARSGAGSVLIDMRGRLNRWMKETDDPALKGPVPAPEGAVVNDPDGVSPSEKARPVGG